MTTAREQSKLFGKFKTVRDNVKTSHESAMGVVKSTGVDMHDALVSAHDAALEVQNNTLAAVGQLETSLHAGSEA
jgi:hypothetical protein